MKTIAKIKYFALIQGLSVKTKYENLTNVSIMKFSIGALIILFFAMWFHAQGTKWELYKQDKQMKNLTEQVAELQQSNAKKDELIAAHQDKDKIMKEFVRELFSDNFYTTRLTGYHPVPEQTDSTPDITADGTKFDIDRAGEYRYVALSRDLLTHFNRRGAKIQFGDYIMIKGTPSQDGIYQVRDTMNKRHTQWIDILLTPGEKSFYYRNVLMCKIPEQFLDDKEILKGIYNHFPEEQPIAMVEPEVNIVM